MAYVVRGLAREGSFRVLAVECREVVEEVRRLQGLSPTATAALGRAIAGVALLAADLKAGRVMLQINGGGPLGEILAEGDAEGNLRGTVANPWVHPEPQAGKLAVGAAVGKNGFLSVVRDLGLKEPYQGSVALVSGEIARDLAYYLTVSEQIPSAVALGVLVDTDGSVKEAGGFMVQRMPSASEEDITAAEKALSEVPAVTEMLSEGLKPEEILERLFPGRIEILGKKELRYRCRCSRERVEAALAALGKEELEEMLRKGEPAQVSCHFCRKEYVLSLEDLRRLLEDLEKRG
ncbi:Hsp33 family molecular chaperone HslO [Thermosulfurimonas dismutans]|uniref:33 kDa chaperonin n=1 Tax=Thermosulfurimonas dismutans TaxID=999894 RepID=A0A179D7H8_9BACT|nr:Hsp33 family molecular chaperone HslO [Thermosulfurimonas dismutans]OAQ21689.1 Chaperonin (heat shock protein 33) [Thermosulfurimonas dismutans]